MSDRLVDAVGLHKAYGTVEVLRGADLSIDAGQTVAVMGASGSGKSTLLHLMGALDRPTSGSVRFRNTDLSGLDAEGMAGFRNRNIGFVFQFHHLLPEFTALENVMIPGLIGGTDLTRLRRNAHDLLDRLQLGHRLDHRPAKLSGGEQQRVAIARALVNDPELLLADEPTGNLDRPNAEAVMRLLLELRQERNLAMVVVTHDAEIASACQLTYELREGRIFPASPSS